MRTTSLGKSAAWSPWRTIAYWVTTVLLALECVVGGMMGALLTLFTSGIWSISAIRFTS
jgi:hypothetical protein